MGFFKKIAKKVKKFSRSKFGKILKIGAAVGLGVVGAGAAVKGVKALKAAKQAKGLISKGKSAVKVGKGIFGGKKVNDKEKKALFGNGIERLTRKLDRKVNRKQRRLLKKAGKLAASDAKLKQSIASAKSALTTGGLDEGFVGEQKAKLEAAEKDGESFLDRAEDAVDDVLEANADGEKPDHDSEPGGANKDKKADAGIALKIGLGVIVLGAAAWGASKLK